MNQSEDLVDAAALAAAKKESIVERLNKRNKDRLNFIDVKLEQRNKENSQQEDVDYFAQMFTDHVHKIELRIQNIKDAAAKKSSSGDAPPNVDLARIFTDITLEIQELQHYLTTSTMFLSDFKVRTCQNILNDLLQTSDELREKLLPKKKFGFGGKRTKTHTPAPVETKKKTESSVDGGTKQNNAGFSWTISDRQDEYICLKGSEVNGKDISISSLHNCFVEIRGHAGSIQISHANNCTILCGPIARSLFAEHCQQNSIAVACQQLRLHSSQDIRLYMHVTCRAIIEDCQKIGVAPYSYDYEGIEQDYQASGLDKAQNNYKDIADFNWLSPDIPSPNWHLLKEETTPNWSDVCIKFKDLNPTEKNL